MRTELEPLHFKYFYSFLRDLERNQFDHSFFNENNISEIAYGYAHCL